MTWLITGSLGFIGSRLLKEIPGAYTCDLKENCNAARLTIEPTVTHIAHLAATAGIAECASHPERAFRNNVLTTQNILEIARATGCYVAFASSAAAASPVNPYAAHKAACEALCLAYRKTYGLNIGILRLGNVYGPGSFHKTSVVASFCKQALAGGPILVEGTGTQTRDFVHVNDVVSVIQDQPDGLWSGRTGHQVPVVEVARVIADLAGVAIESVPGRSDDACRSVDDSAIVPVRYSEVFEGVSDTWEWFLANQS